MFALAVNAQPVGDVDGAGSDDGAGSTSRRDVALAVKEHLGSRIYVEYLPLDDVDCPDLLAPGFTVAAHIGDDRRMRRRVLVALRDRQDGVAGILDIGLAAIRLLQLCQAKRRGHACGAAADDSYVVDVGSGRSIGCHEARHVQKGRSRACGARDEVDELKARLDIRDLPEEDRGRNNTVAGLLVGVCGAYPSRHLRSGLPELHVLDTCMVTSEMLADDGVLTPDGRARFFAERYRPVAEPVDARYPIRLTTSRLRESPSLRSSL